jgi:signal transduction histidine kinase
MFLQIVTCCFPYSGNLISNGIKYSHKGGKIAVSAKKRDKIIIEIKDDGIGIIKDKLYSNNYYFRHMEKKDKEAGIG